MRMHLFCFASLNVFAFLLDDITFICLSNIGPYLLRNLISEKDVYPVRNLIPEENSIWH